MGVRWDHCCGVCVPWAVKGWEAAPLCPACTGNRGVLWAVLHCTSALTRPSSALPLYFVSATMLSPHPSGIISPFAFFLGISGHCCVSVLPQHCLPPSACHFSKQCFEGRGAFLCWLPCWAWGVARQTPDRRCSTCCLKWAERDKRHIWLHGWRKDPQGATLRFFSCVSMSGDQQHWQKYTPEVQGVLLDLICDLGGDI